MRAAAAFALLCAFAGCLDAGLVPCGEQACPYGDVCTPGGCATPTDVEACKGMPEGADCRAASGAAGTCQGGACRTGLCGNGKIDIGEICDDKNQISGDGCRADCQKIERCGDGVVDVGEACDDGNQNAADGCDACAQTTWQVKSVVGSPTSATSTALGDPNDVALDSLGRLYIADTDNHRIRRIELDGSVTTIAGTGEPGFAGDDGPATSAELHAPGSVAVDGIGRVFIADTQNQRVRRIDLDGTIHTLAGTGQAGFAGDGSAAILAQLQNPHGVIVDGLGRVFVADTDNHRIRRIDVDDTIDTVVGTGTPGFSGDGGSPTAADISSPYAVAIDPGGALVFADSGNVRVRRVDNGVIATIAGSGTPGFGGDGGPATAADFALPSAIGFDGMGRMYIADALNERIRRVELNGTINTIAGNGMSGFSGDGGPATAASFSTPLGLAVASDGTIAIADTLDQRIRHIDASGMIDTIGGTGAFGFGGETGVATAAALLSPYGVCVDASDRIVIADTFHHRVRRIEANGTVSTVAGAGTAGYSGDAGPATAAQLNKPEYVTVDKTGRVIVADTYNQRVRRVEADGSIVTIAGNGVYGYTGEGVATSVRLYQPNGIAVDAQNRVIIADTYNSRIRRVDTAGNITTVAGTGGFGGGGDGGAATAATLGFPYGVAVDPQNRIVIADTGNHKIRRIDTNGIITTVAGNGTVGYSGDGGPALAAQLNSPYGVTFDTMGRIVITDAYNNRIRRIETDGTIVTISGTGAPSSDGDGGPATAADSGTALGLAADSTGHVIIADTHSHHVRRIESDGTIVTVAGKIDPDDIGPVATARLADPQQLVIAGGVTFVAGGTTGTVEMIRNGRVDVVAGRYPQTQPTGALARYRTDSFGKVGGVAFDASRGRIYITETTANRLHVISQVDPNNPKTWTIAPLANGAGTAGASDGAAASATFRGPTGLYLDATTDTLYIADTGNHAIRALALATNQVSTIVNTSHALGFAGDGGAAASARLYEPSAITKCSNGDLFIADTSNNRVRRVVKDALGVLTISTVLGDGVPASSGEGDPASTFPVDAPRGVVCDAAGNLFVTSRSAVRMLPASDTGIIDGTGSVETIYGAPPHSQFPSSVTTCLTGITAIGADTLQVADACTGLLVQLTRAPAQ